MCRQSVLPWHGHYHPCSAFPHPNYCCPMMMRIAPANKSTSVWIDAEVTPNARVRLIQLVRPVLLLFARSVPCGNLAAHRENSLETTSPVVVFGRPLCVLLLQWVRSLWIYCCEFPGNRVRHGLCLSPPPGSIIAVTVENSVCSTRPPVTKHGYHRLHARPWNVKVST